MMEKGTFYTFKCKEYGYGEKLRKCIESACEYCIESAKLAGDPSTSLVGKRPIMLLGKIQSGKTRAYTGLMALAFDNSFDMVIILTKNSAALVSQTYKRMRQEFKKFIYDNEVEVFDIMKAIEGLTDYELDKKLIVIAKKETKNLDKISNFISQYTINERKRCLVIDDEADTTGIGFYKIKDTDEFDLRTVASKVNSIRGSLIGCVFIQVTATPYALYLQPKFEDTKQEPIRPELTVLVPSGSGYIGGDYYFIESKKEGHPASYIYEEVSQEEHNIISMKKADRRVFKDEDILIKQDKLKVFKQGLMNFIVGGCVLRMLNHNQHYSFVIHTNTQKSSHHRLENIAKEFCNQLKKRDEVTQPIIDGLLKDAFIDIERSVMGHDHKMPYYDDVKGAFYYALDKDYISITIVNSDKDVATILDEDSGELKLRSPLSIFVGGQVLDRGVTIPKMIGFYYGRNPKTMQQDTVMQHSRMFGYRDEDLLSVTRFYTTRRIYENMTKITEIDTALREDIEEGKFDAGIYFIQRDERGQIVPCSPDKIRLSNIVMLKPWRRLLPVGFSPVKKTQAIKIVGEINKHISKLITDANRGAVLVQSEELEKIIKKVYSSIVKDPESERFVSCERFLTTLRYLAGDDKKAYLIVRRGRTLAKYKKGSSIYSDAPDTPRDELSIAQRVADRYPAVIMIHQDGTADGWNGREFWWPVLVIQNQIPSTIFALDDTGEKIKKN